MKKVLQSRWIEFIGLLVAIIVAKDNIHDFIQELFHPIEEFGLGLTVDALGIIRLIMYVFLFFTVLLGYKMTKDMFKGERGKSTWMFFLTAGITFALSVLENAILPSTLLIELIIMMIVVLGIIYFTYILAIMAYYDSRW